MRAMLQCHESKEEFDAGNQCDDEGDERERLLRLPEDVMRKSSSWAERDTAVL